MMRRRTSSGPPRRWLGGLPRVGAALLGALLTLVAGPRPASGQEAAPAVVAEFREATALDVDPMGRLYVADAGRDLVHILRPGGASVARLGGPGTRAGEFDDPRDLDPTNGQRLLVADAGNGRVQQFSAERQYLGALPVGPRREPQADRQVFDDGRDGADVQGTGRPIAVASSATDATFVVDGRDRAVVRFDARGRAERGIGATGGLERPVALALEGSRRLYVADRGRNAVRAYDLFGTFVRRLPLPETPNVQALSVHRGRLWIVCSRRVFIWSLRTERTRSHAVSLDAALVDAVPWKEQVFLLTETELLRREGW